MIDCTVRVDGFQA